MIGKIFDRLTVIDGPIRRPSDNRQMWLCRCECGTVKWVMHKLLNSKATRSCGCLKKDWYKRRPLGRCIDETGNTYGDLTVVAFSHQSEKGQALWTCVCKCGKTTIVRGSNLRRKRVSSCGCLAKEKAARMLTGKKGEKGLNWRGGRYQHQGYTFVYRPDHPRSSQTGYLLEHILIAEQVLGEYLPKGSVIHHINGNKSDNRPENLMWFSSLAKHTKFHAEQRKMGK